MKRKEFIKTCSVGCLGLSAFGVFLQSCSSPKMVVSPIVGDNMIVPISEFEITTKSGKSYRPYVISQNGMLLYPICIYRLGEKEYTALFMRCTHQGTELQVFGDKLQCPAHGSEFGNRGNVTNGPASTDLRTFPVTIDNELLKISLK